MKFKLVEQRLYCLCVCVCVRVCAREEERVEGSINVADQAVVTSVYFPLRAAGGAASEGAVSAASEAGGPGKRPAAAAGGTGISGAEGPGPHSPA